MNTRFKVGDIVMDDYRCPGKVLEIVEIRNDSTLPIRAQEVDFNRVWNYTSDGAGVVGGLPILRLKTEFSKNCDLIEGLDNLLGDLDYQVYKVESKVNKSIKGLESTVLACTAALLITIIFFQIVSYFN